MRRLITGQMLLILCCVFYLIWWYRGFRPGTAVNRVGGANGILLLITTISGMAGIIFSLSYTPMIFMPKIKLEVIITIGIISYFVLMLVTRIVFQRIVTTELALIVGWTMLEMIVLTRLDADRVLYGRGYMVMCFVIAAAFAISMILYVAYYRMEEMKAFYAAMIPLITEAASMAALVGIVLAYLA